MTNLLKSSTEVNQRTVGFLLRCMHCHDGVASHCETLVKGLIANGWKVILITGKVHYDSSSGYRFKSIKSMVEDWIILDGFNALRPNLKSIIAASRAIRAHRIDLFHVHGYSMLPFAFLLKIISGVRSVATYHPSVAILNPNERQAEAEPLRNLRYRILLNVFAPESFIAYSTEIEKWLENDARVPKSKIRKILHGIDTEYFRLPNDEERYIARLKYGIKEVDLVCVLVGRLSWDKGHDVLINAVKLIKAVYPVHSVKCLFAGSGGEEEIKKYAFSGVDDSSTFLFAGNVVDVREVYWAGDIFVLPSRVEGFALAVAEAMCCGLSSIRTPSGGARDQIENGKTGYIVPFDDANALSRAILGLKDQDHREQIGRLGSEDARVKFDARRMVEKTIEVYIREIEGCRRDTD